MSGLKDEPEGMVSAHDEAQAYRAVLEWVRDEAAFASLREAAHVRKAIDSVLRLPAGVMLRDRVALAHRLAGLAAEAVSHLRCHTAGLDLEATERFLNDLETAVAAWKDRATTNVLRRPPEATTGLSLTPPTLLAIDVEIPPERCSWWRQAWEKTTRVLRRRD